MAKSTSYLFTNNTATTSKVLSLYDMSETTNYGVATNANNRTRLTNTTGGNFGVQSESITYKASIEPKVDVKIPVPNPDKKAKAVQYSVGVEELLRTTDSADPDFIQDDPIYVQITLRHTQSAFITEALLAQALGRAVSALQHANGDWRFNELANLSTQPSSN